MQIANRYKNLVRETWKPGIHTIVHVVSQLLEDVVLPKQITVHELLFLSCAIILYSAKHLEH